MLNEAAGSPLVFKFKRQELLEKIKANRTRHVEEHAETMRAYRQSRKERLIKAAKLMADAAQELNEGGVGDLDHTAVVDVLHMPEPKLFVEHYDDAIAMLEMASEDEVALSQGHFRQLVQDKWRWKDEFLSVSAMYC